MNTPTPALVTRRGAVPLPRPALLLLCVAYVLPGLLGRDPWRNADLTAFALMQAMASGRTDWLAPTLGGLPVDTPLLPHWLGAASIVALGPVLGDAVAARIPFAVLLAGTLALLWSAVHHLARTEAAQPVAFAFGGEAAPADYARAMADAALLAFIATLGLLQMGHETTPELAQLAAVAGVLWALAVAPFRPRMARAAALMAWPALAACGAPAIALVTGLGGALVCRQSGYGDVRRLVPWILAATLMAIMLATWGNTWIWRIGEGWRVGDVWSIGRQWLWFLWPTWPAVLWTLWRWRRHLAHRHVAVPLLVLACALAANLVMRGSDRALLLALPGAAALAAFALPTLQRSATAAIDWLSMSFFTACAIGVWVIYMAMQTGTPAKPAANVARLAPDFTPVLVWADLIPAALATVVWLWLLRWRTGRHREAVWKSMVLPAGGVTLVWLLLLTLWRPLLDHARSASPWVEAIRPHLSGTAACVIAPGMPTALTAALEVHGPWRVLPEDDGACPWRLRVLRDQPKNALAPAAPADWHVVAMVRRPTDREELTVLWRRQPL